MLNHSTHVEGLTNVLAKFTARVSADECHTVVPGRMRRTRGASSRGGLSFRLTTSDEHGHKALARGGGAVQEVFFRTTLPRDAIAAHLEAALGGAPRKVQLAERPAADAGRAAAPEATVRDDAARALALVRRWRVARRTPEDPS